MKMKHLGWLICSVGIGVGCDSNQAPVPPSASGENPWQAPITRPADTGVAMTNRLAVIADRADPSRNQYLSADRVALQARELAKAMGFKRKSYYHQEYAKDLLNAGRSEEAVQAFDAMEAYLREANPDFLAEHRVWLLRKQAISWLRLGEQENCIDHHHPESCLFPIGAAGVHEVPRGSQGAIEKLETILELDPSLQQARWLLNVAYMTLGRYPKDVPSAYRIPRQTFESDYPLPRFEERASELGAGVVGLSGGSIMEDFDGDGRLDLMCSGLGLREPLRLLRNRGEAGFEDISEAAGLAGLYGGLNLMQTDYNNDGWADVFVLRGGWFGVQGHHPNSLLRNNGDGTFTDVTEEAGLLSLHPTQTAVWFDFDSDGYLDVFIGNESSRQDVHLCELYRNNGDGTFSECAAKFDLAIQGMVKGVTGGDFDNDGRPDLYLSLRGQMNQLLRNEGPTSLSGKGDGGWAFRDVATPAGVTQPLRSFPTWFWDYDNDGWLDLWVSDYRLADSGDILADYLGEPHASETARVYRNRGDGTFEDASERVGLKRILYGMGCNYGDLDNDGFLDFYVGTGDPDLGTLMPNRMFRNDGGQRFQDVTTAGGFGHLQKGHGVSFGDLDNDGDQDVYQDMGGAYSGDTYQNALYLNPGTPDSHFVVIGLDGEQSNRPGIGARLELSVSGPGGGRRIHRVVSTGGSFGASPFRQHLGLGTATRLDSLSVRWPSGVVTRIDGPIAMDQAYRLREGENVLRDWSLPHFQFQPRVESASSGAHEHGAEAH